MKIGAYRLRILTRSRRGAVERTLACFPSEEAARFWLVHHAGGASGREWIERRGQPATLPRPARSAS